MRTQKDFTISARINKAQRDQLTAMKQASGWSVTEILLNGIRRVLEGERVCFPGVKGWWETPAGGRKGGAA